MKLEIVLKCIDGPIMAGLTAKQWMQIGLEDLKKDQGAHYRLIVERPMPLLDANVIVKAASIMDKRYISVLELDGGRLIKSGVASMVGKLDLHGTKVVTQSNIDEMSRELYLANAKRLSRMGVRISSVDTVFIDGCVKLDKGVIVEPMCVISGQTSIGEDSIIGSFTRIDNCVVGKNTHIKSSHLEYTEIGDNCVIGPYANLRSGTKIDDDVRVGDYVEIKNSTLARGVKSAHHAYIGDAYIGTRSNVGCGVVFANYDGKTKLKTQVGDDVFIGCNTNLVAPIKIGDGSFIAAGSTVTKDVDEDSFVIARERETIKRKKR